MDGWAVPQKQITPFPTRALTSSQRVRYTSAGCPPRSPPLVDLRSGLPKGTLRPRSRDRYLVVMSTRKFRQKDGAVYFATFSCHEWVPLFTALQA